MLLIPTDAVTAEPVDSGYAMDPGISGQITSFTSLSVNSLWRCNHDLSVTLNFDSESQIVNHLWAVLSAAN